MNANLASMVKSIVDKETADFLNELPRTIRQKLTASSFAILGFDASWGNNSLKLSENGSAFFSTLLTEEVKKHCKKLVPGIAKRALKLVTEKRLDSLMDSLAYTYTSTLQKSISDRLETLAKKHTDEISKKMEQHFTGALLDNLDLNDPSSFSGKLGEFALEAIAKDITTGKTTLLDKLPK